MVTIIGAGPVGCYTGYLLSKQGFNVNIYEEHGSIGSPVHCTGLFTDSINDIIHVRKDCIVNKISKAIIFSPDKRFIEINLKNKDILVDRQRFDKSIADLAIKSGAKIHYRQKYANHCINGAKDIDSSILIGADGPNSSVSKDFFLSNNLKYFIGIQAIARGNFEKDTILFYPIKKGFSWVVPESESIARIGTATMYNPKDKFNNLISQVGKIKILKYQGGLIPIYNPFLKTEFHSKNKSVYLVGDAAAQVKATTGGGLVPGLKSAKCLFESIINKNSYEKSWKREVGYDLLVSLMIRRVLNNCTGNDITSLVNICNNEKIKDTLSFFDRDNIIKLVFNAISSEPRLLRYLTKIV